MRVFIAILICTLLCACSTRSNYAELEDAHHLNAKPKTYLFDYDGKSCPPGGCIDETGGEAEPVNLEEKDSVLFKVGKAVFLVVGAVVVIGLTVLSRVPAGAL